MDSSSFFIHNVSIMDRKPVRCKILNRKHISSFIVFASTIIFFNLCPSSNRIDNHHHHHHRHHHLKMDQESHNALIDTFYKRLTNGFISNYINLNLVSQSKGSYIQLAEAKVLGKVAKMWYIKKKIKKLNKKLKKHTIAVPVITAIPIYEHSYYPSPHVTHIAHPGMHHAAAASYYAPAYAQAPAATTVTAAANQLAASASNTHQQVAAYRMSPHHGLHPHHHPSQTLYHAHAQHPANHHQIINAYTPGPPVFVDDTAGLYGHYGNAYGRYDGGFQLW